MIKGWSILKLIIVEALTLEKNGWNSFNLPRVDLTLVLNCWSSLNLLHAAVTVVINVWLELNLTHPLQLFSDQWPPLPSQTYLVQLLF